MLQEIRLGREAACTPLPAAGSTAAPFVHSAGAHVLKRFLFPVGSLRKSESWSQTFQGTSELGSRSARSPISNFWGLRFGASAGADNGLFLTCLRGGAGERCSQPASPGFKGRVHVWQVTHGRPFGEETACLIPTRTCSSSCWKSSIFWFGKREQESCLAYPL